MQQGVGDDKQSITWFVYQRNKIKKEQSVPQ